MNVLELLHCTDVWYVQMTTPGLEAGEELMHLDAAIEAFEGSRPGQRFAVVWPC
jgi:hypothetical protein